MKIEQKLFVFVIVKYEYSKIFSFQFSPGIQFFDRYNDIFNIKYSNN